MSRAAASRRAKGAVTLRIQTSAPATGTLALKGARTAKLNLVRAGAATVRVKLGRKVQKTLRRKGQLISKAILTLRTADGRTASAARAVTITGR